MSDEYKGTALKGWQDGYRGYDPVAGADEVYLDAHRIGVEDAEKDKDMGRYGSSNA
jgi:hypothetical protein